MTSILVGAVLAFTAWAAILASASGSRTTAAHYAVPLIMSSMMAMVFWRALIACWQTRVLAGANDLPHIYASTGGANDNGGSDDGSSSDCPNDEPPSQIRKRGFEELFPSRDAIMYVMGVLRSLGVRQEHRADVCQDVMEAAVKSFCRFDPAKLPAHHYGRFPPQYRWLNRIAVHFAAHYHSAKGDPGDPEPNELDVDDLVERAPDPTLPPDELLATEQDQSRLDTNVWRLLQHVIRDPMVRECVVDHHMYGEQVKAIADRLGVPRSTMYKKEAQAVRELRGLLEQEFPGEPFHRIKGYLAEDFLEWGS